MFDHHDDRGQDFQGVQDQPREEIVNNYYGDQGQPQQDYQQQQGDNQGFGNDASFDPNAGGGWDNSGGGDNGGWS